MVESEMNMKNDIGYIFTSPIQKLENMTEIGLAIKLSKYITHAIPFNSGFIMANTRSAYLSKLEYTSKIDSNLIFDKDDGFVSSFGEESKTLQYLNSLFQKWKNNNYKDKMSDYYNKI